MIGLSAERLERLRERALAGPDTPVGWRCLAYCRAALEHAGDPIILRRAAGLAGTILNFPPSVVDDELIVGSHMFGERPGVDGSLEFPEFASYLFEPPGDRLRELLSGTDLGEAQRQTVLELIGRPSLFTGEPWSPGQPDEVRLALEATVFMGGGWCTNHSVRDYAKVLRVGFEGIVAEIDARRSALACDDPDRLEELTFLRSASTVAHAAAGIGRRHAVGARALARRCNDADRRAELRAIAKACDRVPARPARTLREAVQALWFAHTITCCEDHINANSIGRIDQILEPYYQADLAAGRITREAALDLITYLWLKLYRDYDVQQAVLGGLRPDGGDATNEVTYLCLEATQRLGLVRCLSVRLHRRAPRELVERATDLLSDGGGIPFFFNDEAIIPALTDKGIPLEEARDYAVIGCVEITIPGRANPHAVSHNMNLAKCLELALHNGWDPRTGAQVGPETGLLAEFPSAGAVFEAYARQVEHFARCGVFVSNAGQLQQQHSAPLPYLSILTEDCIARGRDVTSGGARYNYHSCSAIGIPNVADSLAAMETVVFSDRKLTLEALRQLLLVNFDGAEAERKLLLRAPKYGNDVEEVDRWAGAVAEHYCRTMSAHRTHYGGSFHAHLFSFVWHVDPFGRTTGALPDGRRAGDPLAYSLSPTQGRDEKGVTALMRSLARIPHHLAAGSSSAIIELSPRFFEGDGKRKFVSLLEGAVDLGIGQMQFNVVTAERLVQAQEDPERYGNVVVRVSGFSQRFASIGKDLQDHIIARTKHEA